MRFSDMMGSGDDRSAKTESERAISDALAPYLDAAPPVEAAVVETAVAEAPVEAPVAAETEAPAPKPHTVEAVFPVERVVPAERAQAEQAPVAEAEPAAMQIADFTPLSDDLLPRRR